MGDLVTGDDGLPAEVVGAWAKEKHEYLCRYVDISRGVRAKFNGPRNAGATFIDLFCGPGRCQIKGTKEFIDGGAVAAWKQSVASKAPYTRVIVADLDGDRRGAAVERLQRLGAPVVEFPGAALGAVEALVETLGSEALHFAYLDPYALGALDFRIIETLSRLKRMDLLIHVSKMDMQRNFARNFLAEDESAFDLFAPGWRARVPELGRDQSAARAQVVEFWRGKVAALGIWPSTDMTLITGAGNQHLYWLLLAARHELAHKFWKVAAASPQGKLEF